MSLLHRNRRNQRRASTNAAKLRVEALEDRLTPAYTATNVAYQTIDLVPGAAGITSILTNSDDATASIDIGANSFNFYGTTYTGAQLFTSPNGLITFGSSNSSFNNGPLDLTGPAQAAIAVLWDDLVTNVDLNDQVLYTIDTATNRLTVEWNAVYNYNTGSSPITFQAILDLNTGTVPGAITLNYVTIDTGAPATANGASATVGIKDADTAPGGNAALTTSNDTTTYAGGQAVQFTDYPVNVPPSIAISGAASVAEGATYTLTLGTVTDPGHTVSAYTVNWGDGTTDTYATAGAKTHTYADGPTFPAITVDFVDDRGPYTNTANALSVSVVDVAPTIAISGAATAVEGNSYTLTLGATTDPGTDTITQYIVRWGDGTSNAYPTAGAKTHVYNSRPTAYAITVDLIDEDGTHTNAANALGVTATNSAPIAVFGTGPTLANEGSPVSFTATFSDVGGAQDSPFTYRWRVVASNGQVIPDATGSIAAANYGTVPAFGFTPRDNGTYTVTLIVTDKDNAQSTPVGRALTVRNLAPTATLVNDGPQTGTAPVRISFVGSSDASTVDAASLRYSFDFNNDGDFTDPGEIADSSSPTALYVAPTGASSGVRGRIGDKDGGYTDLFTDVEVHLTAAGVGTDVVVYYNDGTPRFALRPYVGYTGNITLAVGDVTGDGVDDIVTGTQTAASHIKVFDGNTGTEIASFLAYQSFTGGVSVAVGDVLGKGYAQIITGAGPGGGPHVKVFDLGAGGAAEAVSFFAYDAGFLGGVTVAAGKLDSSGHDLLVTGAGPGGGPHVKVFDVASQAPVLIRSFLAPDFGPAFQGGVNVAAADGLIAIGAGPGGGGKVSLYNSTPNSVSQTFAPYNSYNGDVRVAFGDRDGVPVLITGSGPGAAPTVRVFRLGDLFLLDGHFLGSVAFNGGVFVA